MKLVINSPRREPPKHQPHKITVPNEPAISEDFERYDDAEELRRLIRAVKFSQKHFLYFVCCNQVPKQNELIAAVKKEFKGKKIRVVRFKKPITDLLGELQKKKIAADCEAVFAQGLEYSISSDGKGAENALIYNLNISRDSFKRYLLCPLFLWLPEYAIVKITRHAPDFFSVRSGTFYFSSPPEQVTEQIFQSISSNWIESSSLPIAEKLKQIQTLENLLAEYRGLHLEKQDRTAEIRLLSKLADFLFSISEYRKAIKYYEESLVLSRAIGNRQNEGISLGSLGNTHDYLGESQMAIKYLEESLMIFREIGDKKAEGASLGNLGNAYYRLGKYKKAIEYQEQASTVSQETGYRHAEGTSSGNLGLIYNSLGDYQKAIKYHKQSLTISREIGNRFGESSSLGNLGVAYNRIGEYRKAIECNEQALIISREIGNREVEANSLINLGVDYDKLGKKKEARVFWEEALTIYELIKSPSANDVRQWIEENYGN